MSDLMHGLGTSYVATLFVAPAWAVVSLHLCLGSVHSTGSWLSAGTLATLLAVLHRSNYARVREKLTHLVENGLATHLTQSQSPVLVFVDRTLLKACEPSDSASGPMV
jgi:hypothetical protein